MKKIPLHSLVIDISNTNYSKFPSHETISISQVQNDLVGKKRPELESIIRNEVFRRCALKLSLGERVVFHGSTLTKDQRIALAKMAISQGSPVFYLIDDTIDHSFIKDDYGEIVKDAIIILPVEIKDLRNNFKGITVVGDVHGDVNALVKAISWAKSRNHFIWFLGDIVDYGPDPIEAMNIVYKEVMEGCASVILGNHERKIAKWIQQKDETTNYRLKLSEGNKVTVNALNTMSPFDQTNWCGKFRSVIARSSLIVNVENITMAHAAIHPDYWVSGNNVDIENFALYGEPDQNSYEFKLSHDWIEKIPNGKIVIVGHESHGIPYPLLITCQNGGKVIFLDTGCGKGGPLSTADIQFDSEKTLKLGNFNRHS